MTFKRKKKSLDHAFITNIVCWRLQVNFVTRKIRLAKKSHQWDSEETTGKLELHIKGFAKCFGFVLLGYEASRKAIQKIREKHLECIRLFWLLFYLFFFFWNQLRRNVIVQLIFVCVIKLLWFYRLQIKGRKVIYVLGIFMWWGWQWLWVWLIF